MLNLGFTNSFCIDFHTFRFSVKKRQKSPFFTWIYFSSSNWIFSVKFFCAHKSFSFSFQTELPTLHFSLFFFTNFNAYKIRRKAKENYGLWKWSLFKFCLCDVLVLGIISAIFTCIHTYMKSHHSGLTKCVHNRENP